ncbi:PorT family protein [Ancylomarina sp. DW003]|nr:outer membrane beta-barrel protein [Ancylomarina sp. DW003]MDE5423113.1 PorT family protein [Ancylomarina sp. DW003]
MRNIKTKKGPLIRNILNTFIFLALILATNIESKAQVAILASGNYCNIRSDISLENKESLLGYNLGLSIQYYPIKKFKNVSIITEVVYNRKGYQQQFEKNYQFKFNYLSLPILVNYSLSNNIAMHSGIELSTLITTNIAKGKETYKNFDLGLVFGLSCFNKKRISCFSRITYGLTPMLDYYEIDDLGNFSREIHDLKNICLSIGFKINIYNEKIRLYK